MNFNVTLTNAERDHILSLMRSNEDEGWYCGNRKQHWKRHLSLAEKLNAPLQGLRKKEMERLIND